MSRLGKIIENGATGANISTGTNAEVHAFMREIEVFSTTFPLVATWIDEHTNRFTDFRKHNAMVCQRIAQKETELMELYVKKDENGKFLRQVKLEGTMYQFNSPEDSKAFTDAWLEFAKKPCTYEI